MRNVTQNQRREQWKQKNFQQWLGKKHQILFGPEELAKILGIGEPGARKKFDEKDFPRIQGIGSTRKADKNAVRLYIQGINIRTNQKDAIMSLLLFELKKLNTSLELMKGEKENVMSN